MGGEGFGGGGGFYSTSFTWTFTLESLLSLIYANINAIALHTNDVDQSGCHGKGLNLTIVAKVGWSGALTHQEMSYSSLWRLESYLLCGVIRS